MTTITFDKVISFLREIVASTEFWSALFGALAAFALGGVAQWWANIVKNKSAGNLALITLSQMYSLMESIRNQLLVEEPLNQSRLLQREPYEYEIHAIIGITLNSELRLSLRDLGFLVDSHDPDILNRLLHVERGFFSVFELIKRHEELHQNFQLKIEAASRDGNRILTGDLPAIVGPPLFISLVQIVRSLQIDIPTTCDGLHAASGQLRNVLRFQYPLFHFIRFIPDKSKRSVSVIPESHVPTIWRRTVRWSYDALMFPIERLFRRKGVDEISKEETIKIQRYRLPTDRTE